MSVLRRRCAHRPASAPARRRRGCCARSPTPTRRRSSSRSASNDGAAARPPAPVHPRPAAGAGSWSSRVPYVFERLRRNYGGIARVDARERRDRRPRRQRRRSSTSPTPRGGRARAAAGLVRRHRLVLARRRCSATPRTSPTSSGASSRPRSAALTFDVALPRATASSASTCCCSTPRATTGRSCAASTSAAAGRGCSSTSTSTSLRPTGGVPRAHARRRLRDDGGGLRHVLPRRRTPDDADTGLARPAAGGGRRVGPRRAGMSAPPAPRLARLTASSCAPALRLVRLTDDDRRYLTTLHDDACRCRRAPRRSSRRTTRGCVELRARLRARSTCRRSAPRAGAASAVDDFLDLRYFRGETLITWHYRELAADHGAEVLRAARATSRERDALRPARPARGGRRVRLLDVRATPATGACSRDLLESVNEIAFLERELGLVRARTASRCSTSARATGASPTGWPPAFPNLARLLLRRRDPRVHLPQRATTCATAARVPPARVVRLDELDARAARRALRPRREHPLASPSAPTTAIEWWVGAARGGSRSRACSWSRTSRTELLIARGGRQPARLRAAARARRATGCPRREPVIDDPAVRAARRRRGPLPPVRR